ncbi:major facilitator superfamily MFS_1 [Gloeothece citriformis PCC 7424]|uniref:Major facilitator superfamily MFS_1 n=1 Tax=Gloeothece citriformis (strain PCC 7424) TaxID=65393 RepID=B7KAS1_GLOC7|nr:MFS transporter [Gloeothece citriformis]ACK68743.1 major facilitator superfamily MFS_1 [Gloeothece citriformis PCC 7424]
MSLAFINIFLSLFTFGIVVAFLGASKLYIAQKLGLNDARMAWLISLNQFSNLLGTLIAGYGLVSISYKLVLGSGFLLIIGSIWLVGTYQIYWPVTIALSGLGLGGSFLNVGSNALLPVLRPNNPSSITNLAHACFGFGALVLPILLTLLLRRFGWRKALNILTFLILIPTLMSLVAFYPTTSNLPNSTNSFSFLANKTILLAMLASFCYVAIEASLATWLTTYLKQAGWNEIKASGFVAFFWLALMVGRLLASSLLTANNGLFLIQLLTLILIITLMSMTTFITLWTSVLSVVMLGFCCAPIFPTLVGVTFAKFDSALSGNIYALVAAVGMGGATILPYIVGRVSSSISIYYGLRILILPASILLLTAFYL